MRNLVPVILLFITLPIIDFISFKVLQRKQSNVNHKMNYYFYILIELWVSLFIAVFINISQSNLLSILGLGLIRIGNNYFGDILSIIIISVSILLALFLIFDMIRLSMDKQYQLYLIDKIDKIKKPEFINLIKPISRKELILFTIVGLSAGIIEEILYRAVLIHSITNLLPQINGIIVIILSAFAFALGHLYQGLGGIVRTLILGIILGIIYLASNSVILCIIIHILIDLTNIIVTNIYENKKPSAA